MGNSYDAFISYARQNSEAEASALQSGLQSFGKKWTELRALRVFRAGGRQSRWECDVTRGFVGSFGVS